MNYRQNTLGRRVFLREHPVAPWPCYFCDTEVGDKGQTPESLNVHHLDGDTSNNELANLSAAHFRCHVSDHMKKQWKDPAWRAKMSAAVAESNKRRGPTKGMTGKRHTEDTKAKMRAAHARRKAGKS